MRKYIIYTPQYHENVGGVIVLHKLCAMLRDQGCEAKIWPIGMPCMTGRLSARFILKSLSWKLKNIRKSFGGAPITWSPYNLDIAVHADLEDAIVVYPEIVNGNPLGTDKVVRWLLNRPGVVAGEVSFGPDDLFFFFDEQFNDLKLNPVSCNHLHILELMRNTYQDTGIKDRHGTSYMIRKGKGKVLDQHEANSVRIDGMPHQEVAKLFNSCKYFVSYDVYTLYSRYAAMCGCIPVIIPDEGVTKEQWQPKPENRYGIAYGWEDVAWAQQTRQQLLEHLEHVELSNRASVDNFISISQARFVQDNQSH